MKKNILLTLASTVLLSSCVNVITNAAKSTYKVHVRNSLLAEAEAGDAEAQFKVGNAYCCGYGAVYDNKEATKWMCKAARQGYVPAQKKIGWIYRSDQGFAAPTDKIRYASLENNDALAYAWYSIAAKSGDKKANKAREKVAQHLSQAQADRAYEYIQSYPNIACEIHM